MKDVLLVVAGALLCAGTSYEIGVMVGRQMAADAGLADARAPLGPGGIEAEMLPPTLSAASSQGGGAGGLAGQASSRNAGVPAGGGPPAASGTSPAVRPKA